MDSIVCKGAMMKLYAPTRLRSDMEPLRRPNYPLAFICLIAVIVYITIPVAVVVGAWLILRWIMGQ